MFASPAPHTKLTKWFMGKPARLNSLMDTAGAWPNEHPVRLEAPRDVDHLRSHLDPRRRHREESELVTLLLGHGLHDRDAFTAGRVVVVDVSDLRALLGPVVLDELHARARLRPVGRGHREDVRPGRAVSGVGSAEPRRDARDLVVHVPRRQRVHDRRPVVERGHRAVALEPLVGLHAAVHRVPVLDLRVLELVAEHAALLVDEGHVVGQAGADLHPDWSCPGSVDGELLSRSSLHPLRGGYRDSTPGVDRRS